jgi:hypothetical protein
MVAERGLEAEPREHDDLRYHREAVANWRAPIGWSGLIVSASWAFGPSERRFPVQADDSPMSYVA